MQETDALDWFIKEQSCMPKLATLLSQNYYLA